MVARLELLASGLLRVGVPPSIHTAPTEGFPPSSAGRAAVSPARETKEFAAEEVPEALEYIESLPPHVRIYVDEWVQSQWRFVFGDERDRAGRRLSRVAPGVRFRIRPIFLT
jgi:hypothetical protein